MSRQHAIGFLVFLGALAGFGVGRAPAQCQLQKIFRPNGQSSEAYGGVVSVDGNFAAMGGGKLFGKISGNWVEIDELFPSNPKASFGSVIDISGDVAMMDGDPGPFIFRRHGNAWIEEAQLTDPTIDGDFGFVTALSGDIALVGVPPWVFRYDGTDWVTEQELVQPDPPASGVDGFGSRLALSGDVAVVSAWLRTETAFQEGALYVFRYGGRAWAMEQKLVASDPIGYERLGWSVVVEGDVIVAGANEQGTFCSIPGKEEFCRPGAAHVFRHDGNSWVEEQKLVASDGEGNDGFGDAVDVSGDTIVVGAPFHQANGLSTTGAAYVYHWDGAVWTERAKLIVSDPENIHSFGDALAVSGDTAIIGDPRNDANEPGSGAAYVFAVAGDCNANGEIDACEILTDPSLDPNGNLIIDQCENIPTVSQWGLALSGLLLLTAGSVVIHRRRIRTA